MYEWRDPRGLIQCPASAKYMPQPFSCSFGGWWNSLQTSLCLIYCGTKVHVHAKNKKQQKKPLHVPHLAIQSNLKSSWLNIRFNPLEKVWGCSSWVLACCLKSCTSTIMQVFCDSAFKEHRCWNNEFLLQQYCRISITHRHSFSVNMSTKVLF